MYSWRFFCAFDEAYPPPPETAPETLRRIPPWGLDLSREEQPSVLGLLISPNRFTWRGSLLEKRKWGRWCAQRPGFWRAWCVSWCVSSWALYVSLLSSLHESCSLRCSLVMPEEKPSAVQISFIGFSKETHWWCSRALRDSWLCTCSTSRKAALGGIVFSSTVEAVKDFFIHIAQAGDAAVSANVGLANAVGTWAWQLFISGVRSHDL